LDGVGIDYAGSLCNESSMARTGTSGLVDDHYAHIRVFLLDVLMQCRLMALVQCVLAEQCICDSRVSNVTLLHTFCWLVLIGCKTHAAMCLRDDILYGHFVAESPAASLVE